MTVAKWQPPEEFDEYRILGELGSGGMGDVYRARDTLLERDVAIKFTSSARSRSTDARARFLREARAAARIHHPNVATIYRVASVDDRLCLVSELVHGQPLSTLTTPVRWQQAHRHALDLARGLAAAHRNGVVHRDIKPGNVMLTSEGQTKLIDFGLAKLLEAGAEPGRVHRDDDARGDVGLTRDGAVMGTPYYIGPEIWRGEAASPATDVWALGIVIYELCSGAHPYADVAADELAGVSREPRALADVVAGLEGRFGAIIDRCLAIEPANRFADAGELATALESIADTDEGDARAAPIIDKLRSEGRALVVSEDGAAASILCAQHVIPSLDDARVIVATLDVEPCERLRAALATLVDEGETLDDVELFSAPEITGGTSLLERLGPGDSLALFLDRLDGITAEDEAAVSEMLAPLAADGRVSVVATTTSAGLARVARVGALGEQLAAAVVDIDSRETTTAVAATSADGGGSATVATTPRGWRAGLAAIGLAIALAATTFWAWPRSALVTPVPGEVPAATPRTFLVPGTIRRLTLDEGCEEFPSWTADGRAVVFDATHDGGFALFRRQLDASESVRLTAGKVWNFAPAVSPDGENIAFVRRDENGELSSHVADRDGNNERPIGAGRLRPSWSADGKGLWIGSASDVTRFDTTTWRATRKLVPPTNTILFRVHELRDGRIVGLAYPEDATSSAKGIVLYAAGSDKEPTWLWETSAEDVLAVGSDGSVYGARKSLAGPGELWRIPLDGREPEVVVAAGAAPTLGMSFSPDGRKLAWSDCSFDQKLATLAAVSPDQPMRAIPTSRGAWNDWEAIAVPGTDDIAMISDRGGAIEIWVSDREQRRPARRIATPELVPGSLAVSPDASLVAFTAEDKGIYVVDIDGKSKPRAVLEGSAHFYPVFSHDGNQLIFQTENGAGEARLGIVGVGGGEVEIPFDRSSGEPAVSPDGGRIAYLLEVDAGAELSVPMIWDRATDEHVRVAETVLEPGWYHHLRFSPDGRRILVLQGGRVVREIELATNKVLRTFQSGEQQLTGATYSGDDVMIGLSGWVGGIWTADVR